MQKVWIKFFLLTLWSANLNVPWISQETGYLNIAGCKQENNCNWWVGVSVLKLLICSENANKINTMDTKIDSLAFTFRYAHSLIQFTVFKVIRPNCYCTALSDNQIPSRSMFFKIFLGRLLIEAIAIPVGLKMIRNNITYSTKQSFKIYYNNNLHGYFDPNII